MKITFNRIFVKAFTSVLMILFLLFIISPILNEGASADNVELLDFCIGVDHPPFEEDYGGDGYSYLRLGLTVSFSDYDESDVFRGELTGASGPVSVENALDSSGQLFFAFPLYGYGDYVVSVYDPNDMMIFSQDVVVNESEMDCDKENLDTSPPKVVTEDPVEEPTTEADEPTDEEASEPEVTTPTVVDEGDSDDTTEEDKPWWPLLLIAGGPLLILIGGYLIFNNKCEKERKAWLQSMSDAKKATDHAREKENKLEQISEDKEQLQQELDDIRRTYPSAGKESTDDAWIEMDGRRITSKDLQLKREADQAAWDEYREDPNPDSASDLEEKWKENNAPPSEEERRALDKKAKDLVNQIKKAQEAEKEAQKAADEAVKAEKDAEDKEEKARLAYEACMKVKPAKAEPKPEPKSETPPPTRPTPEPGGTKVAKKKEKPICTEKDLPQERNRRKLPRVSIPVKLEVNIQGGAAHDGAVAANDISGQLKDASEVLGWISKLMDIKGIGETLVREGVGWKLLGSAAPPATGIALDMPTPTSPGQLAVDTLSLLGKISSVIIGKVPELQERRLPDCDLYASITNHVFSPECVEIWKCKNGRWVKDHTRFSLTLIHVSKGKLTPRTALTWADAQKQIRRYESLYRNNLRRELNKLGQCEAGCK